jgi:hypothetical protein
MLDLDALCTCGHTREDHDHAGYCVALNSSTTCECPRFVEHPAP